ncbi:MAG: OmpH family outer membrane protein [Saprospiraceae bacterium]|nr:OmpH family outer membrane protein [Saprospiraceae bacterium]
MKIKNWLPAFIFILATAAFNNTSAQKIIVVDINSVLADLPDYQTAQSELDRVASQWRQEIALEFDKIKSMYNKFQAEQVLLSAEDKIAKEEEIVKKEAEVREMQKQRFGPEGDLFKKRQELVTPIQEKVYAAIEGYAADRGIDIIFDKGGSAGLLFTSQEYDKTADIKKRLNIK